MCARDRRKAQTKPGALSSATFSNAETELISFWDLIPSKEDPCQAQPGVQDHVAFLPPGVLCSGRRIWRRTRIRKLKVTKLQSMKHVCLYGLSLLKSRACGFGCGGRNHDTTFQLLPLSCWVLSLHWRDHWLGTTDQSKSFCLWNCLIWAHVSPLLVNYTRSYWWGSTRNMQTWCDTHQSNSLIWRVIPFCSNLTCHSPSMK